MCIASLFCSNKASRSRVMDNYYSPLLQSFYFFIFCHHNVRAKETSWCLPFNTFPWPELHPISLDLSPTVWGPGVLLIGSLYVPESVGM